MMSSAGKPTSFVEDVVGAGANLDPARERIGLALFVEGHDDRGGAVAADELGPFAKGGFAFLEAERIDDGLAGDAAQAGFDHAPLRAVDHDRHAGDFELGGDEIEEAGHRLFAVEHPFVEVDVDDGGAALDLLARDGQALVEFSLEDELGELGRAGDVGPLADEGERNFGAEGERFQAGVLGKVAVARPRRSGAGPAPAASAARHRARPRRCSGCARACCRSSRRRC